jgi:murein DD-endopeptidase MepM/ murein hydrolase activator NlpD
MSKKGLTILYIPQKQGKRSVQIHLSYIMAILISSILLFSGVGLSFLVWESAQVPDTNALLAETLELGQNKREFTEDLEALERRIALLEIYAMQAEKVEEGGPMGILHETSETILPVRPFLSLPIQNSDRVKNYGRPSKEKSEQFSPHQGVDFFAVRGSPVFASSGGFVDVVYQNKVLGTHILLEHEDGLSTLYAHLS